jgi:transposase-like protein
MECSRCGSTEVVRHGKRKNKHETVQIYLCRTCNRFFAPSTKAIRTSYGKEVLSMAMHLFCRGYSYSMIARIINNIYDAEVSKSTIHRWVGRFKALGAPS